MEGIVSTPYVRSIQRQAAKLRKHVVFTKFMPPHKIPYVYQLADVVVIPSLWQEPFGRVNLEAMASCKAIVTSNRGGIPEVVKHEENGFVVSLKTTKRNYMSPFVDYWTQKNCAMNSGKKGWKG